MTRTAARFLAPYRSNKDLHGRLSKPRLETGLQAVAKTEGTAAACTLAAKALEQADLTPRAICAAQGYLAANDAVTAPSAKGQRKGARLFEVRMLAAGGPDSPGGERILKGEVHRGLKALADERIARREIKHLLQTGDLSAGALQTLQDYLATGQLRLKGGTSWGGTTELRAGDQLFFKAKGSDEAVELEVLEVKTGKRRVEVTSRHCDDFGATVDRKSQSVVVRDRTTGKTSKLSESDLNKGKVVSSRDIWQSDLPEETKLRFAPLDDDWVRSDKLPPNVSVETVGGKPALRISGQLLKVGDGARYDAYIPGDDVELRAEVQIRDIRVDDDGKPQVTVDEYVSGRVRTRRLLAGEIGHLEREDFMKDLIAPYRAEIPELEVVTYPKGCKSIDGARPAFRVGQDIFMAGDDVKVPGAGNAKILTIDSGKERPEVMVRFEGDSGEVRRLGKAEVEGLQIDQIALLARRSGYDSRPAFEVVRPTGEDPFILMGEDKVHAGDFVVFDRCSPGIVPMIVDRIENEGGKDLVWVTEPVPLSDSDERVTQQIEIGGRKVTVSMADWDADAPERAEGKSPYMLYTRPLGWFEHHLMRSEGEQRRKVAGSRASDEHHDKRNAARVARFDTLSQVAPAKLKLLDAHDVQVIEHMRTMKREPLPELGKFSVHDVGWALTRTHSGLHYAPGGKQALKLRNEKIDQGSGLIHRDASGKETPMKVLEVIDGERVRVAAAEDGKVVTKELTKTDNLFLFPDEQAAKTVEQTKRRAHTQRVLAAI